MSKRVLTELECDWCEESLLVPAKKTFFRGFIPADYPDSWDVLKEENICDSCKERAMQAIQQAKHQCQNNGGKKKKKTPTVE